MRVVATPGRQVAGKYQIPTVGMETIKDNTGFGWVLTFGVYY